jgi:hypothetical protein
LLVDFAEAIHHAEAEFKAHNAAIAKAIASNGAEAAAKVL